MAKKATTKVQLEKVQKILDAKFLALDQASLVETKGKGMQLNIKSSSTLEYCLYRFDPDIDAIFPFFNKTHDAPKGLGKICDFILFVEENTTFFILLIEMKVGNATTKKQLDASECFIEYIIKSAERVGHRLEKAIVRKIGINERPKSRKRPTKMQDLAYDPNNFLDYDLATTDFIIRAVLK